MGDTPTDDDTSRECSPQCTARRRLNSSHSLPCLLLAARNRSLRGGRVQPLICDSPVFPASPQPHSTSQPGYGDLIDEDDDDGFRTEVSEKSDRSSSIASTVRWDHSSQRASLLDFVATPYPISALFADKDHRCGNSRNGFYGLQDVLWFASWKHVGNTMSWYNLDESPLFIVPKRGWVRLHAVRFVDGAVFRCTILFAIVMNALSLAFDIPETKDNESIQNFLYVANFVFLVIFTAEAALKTLAMGFAQHKGAYLRSWWNVIDFALLISGYVALHPSVANVTVVRLVRLLRPLRTFSRVAGFRALLAALIGAMPHMANILLLVLFLLTIFALIGIQLWSGGLDNRCYVDLSLANESYSGPLSDDPNASRFAIIASERGCATDSWAYDGLDCNVDTTGVDLPQACRREAGAFHASVYNFDSFPNAVLLAFKVVSLDDWPTDMRQTQDAFGWWTWVYFILLVVLGNVVCVNLMLASMTLVLEQEKNQMRIEAAEAAEEEENKVLMCTWKDGESRKAEGDAGPEATRARTGKDSAANVSTDAVANLCPHSPVAEVPPLGLDAPLERQSSETWQALTNMANVTPVLDTAQRAYIDPKTGIKVRNISVATCHHTFARLAMSVYFSAFLTEPVRREKQTRVEPEHVLAVALAMRFAKSKKLSGSSAKGFGMHDLASRSCPNLMSPMQSMRIIAGRSKAGNMRSPTRSNIDFAATAVAATRPESSSNKRRPSSAIDRREKMGLAHANSMNRLTAEAVESTSELRRQDSNRARFPALAIQPDGDKVLPSDTASTGAVKSPSPCVAEPNTRFASQRSMRRGRAVQKSKVLAWPRRLSSSSTLQSKTSQAVPVPNTPLEPVSEAFAVALATNRTESPAPSGGELETLLTTVQLIRQKVRDVVLSEAVSRIILVITVLNVTLLCTDHHGISEVHESIIEQVSLYCNIIFVVELCVKVPAMGLSDYWRDSYNRTDAALVFVSIPEVIESRGSSVSAIRAFRLFRLARILRVGARLLPKFQSLRVIIAKAAISLKEASYIMLVMLLLVFIYSILGVQLFAAAFPPPVRTNFNSLWEAALTVFIVISGEYWATVMKIAIDSTSPVAALYFVSLFVLGNYILLNLFTSVIIFNFKDSVDDEEDDKHVSAAKAVELATKSALLRSKMAKAMFSSSDAECGKSVAPPSLNLQVATSRSRLLSPISHPLSPLDLDIKESVQTSSNQDPATPAQARPDELCWPTGWAEDGQELRREKVELKEDNKSNTDTALHGTTLGIFSPDSLVRQMFAKVVLHRHFENGLSVLVSLNCIAIALSDPWWHRDRSRELALTVVDSVFTALFTLEMVAKMIVFGLWERYDPNASEAASENPSETGVGGPTGPPKFGEESVDEDANERSGYAMEIMELGDEHQPYLRCAWNRLDLFVVCLCIAGLFIKEFRIFRSLRAVRLVIRSENVKVVLLSLLHALPTMANVLVVLLFVFLVFAAVGIQIFKGALWQCNDPSIFHESDCTGLFNASERETWDGIPMTVETDRMWVNSRANFDHLGAALFTLFEVAIGEGWVTIMYRSIDSKTAGQGASRNARPFVSLFFVAFVTIGSFFAVNLFIGMLVDKFSEMQSYYSGHVFLTAAQAEWVQTVKVLHHAKLSIRSKAPKNRFRRKVYYLVESAYFDSAITLCIVLNVIVLASVHRGQSEQFTVAVEMINHGFLSVYVLEVFFKLFAWGWVDYIRDAVNRFDFALVVISLVGNIFLGSESTSLFRLCRLGRVFRLVSKAGGIRQVLFTLYFALPPLLNLSMLIVVVIYIYGAIGVELFGTVMLHEGLTEHHNFRSLPKASITLFTLCTGETWVDVMEACRVTTNCSGDECGTEWAVPYFVSFMLIGHLVGLNLVIMIIIEVLNHQQTQLTLLNNVENFKHRWLAYDPEAKERVTWRQLMFILRVLEAPLQFPEKAKETSAYLRNLRVPVSEDGLVRYVDVIFGLARIAMRVKDVEARSLNDKGYTNAPQLSGMVFSLHHVYYADIMQVCGLGGSGVIGLPNSGEFQRRQRSVISPNR
ncbi:Muscle calcium channel subunit alpha-1 [Diplonema papillatum]|nr:Muscle calcium channel subunit alpha-1 [Diplonema papillatum]